MHVILYICKSLYIYIAIVRSRAPVGSPAPSRRCVGVRGSALDRLLENGSWADFTGEDGVGVLGKGRSLFA